MYIIILVNQKMFGFIQWLNNFVEAVCKQRRETADYARGPERWCLQDCFLMFSKDECFITAVSFKFKVYMHIIGSNWFVGTAQRQPCNRSRVIYGTGGISSSAVIAEVRVKVVFSKKVGEDMWLCVGWEGLWLCRRVPAFLSCLSLETMADPEFLSCHLRPQPKQPPPPQSHRFTPKQRHIMRHN